MTATLFTNNYLPCPSNNHADTIANITRELEELTKKDIEHLHRRAVALVKCGKFEAALDDASTMVSLDPGSVLPYLCMGHVYTQQGRYGAAIDAYDMGLQAVSSTDPDYHQLSKARFTAQTHNNSRVDFIKRLPTQVIKKMLHDLLSKETIEASQLYEYLIVSRVWRERIVPCLSDLQLGIKRHDGLAKVDYLLDHAASRVISLNIECLITDPYSLLPSISHFSSLRSLCIKIMASGASNHMLSLLSPLASTLEHLDVHSDDDEYFSLGDILSTFPHLTWLRCHGNMGDLIHYPPNLKTLLFSMPAAHYTLDHEHIMDITSRFPELMQLGIHPCTDTRALTSIQENCPHLKILYYNSINHMSSISNLGLEYQHQNDGIKSLHIGCKEKRMHVEIQHLVSFIKRHQHTLQHLDLRYSLTDASVTSFSSVVRDDDDDALFESLRSYTHTVYQNEDLLLARWLAKRSPHLKRVVLQEDEDASSKYNLEPLFDDMACLDELEDFQVDIPSDKPNNSARHFLQHHSEIKSLLHMLMLPKDMPVNVASSDQLGSLSRLERLSMSMYDAGNLCGLEQGCLRLNHLTIHCGFDYMGLRMALAVASLTSLKTLCLHVRHFEYALLPCFKDMHQLQEMTIYRECKDDLVDPGYLEMLPFKLHVLEYCV